jgi:tetrahydromethanopterin S-methyltransferase subunit F
MEEPFLPTISGFTAPIVAGMFGADVDASAFASRAASGDRNAAAAAMVDALLSAITDSAAEPAEPTDAGAKKLAAASLHASLEGWFLAAVPELLSDIVPFEMGHFDVFTKLPEDVVRALGVGRLVRRALQPLVNATATQPMTWYANKRYRPKKLGTSTIARQVARGNWTHDEAWEDLACEGYTDDDIEALLNEASKFLSVAELDLLTRTGQVDQATAIQHLRDAGWDEQTAGALLMLERAKRIESHETAMADAAVTAFADGRIDEGTLDPYTHGTTIDSQHGAQLRELAAAKRALRRKGLSPAEAEACFLQGIVPITDYRAALDRAGYTPDGADALELLLRAKQDAKLTADQHKTQMAAEKAAAAKVKADAAAAKQATIDAVRALKRQGSISTLSDAVIRGLIPIARLEQVLNAEFDPDTVAIYVADVEAKRAVFVAQQAKAAAATKTAGAKGLSVGELSTAVLDGVLTLAQFSGQLVQHGMDPADVDVLTATLQARKVAHDAAVQLRQAAQSKAAAKRIDLSRAEALVRAGHWTMAQYDALLVSLGYDDAARAGLAQLLQDKIAADAKASTTRTTLAGANPAKGLTLAQFRRAVILGTRTLDEFQTFLVAEGYTSDAIATLTAELADDVSTADAARARRAATGSVLDTHALPLSDVARAARLGIITPAAYQAELTARGYSADDIALELGLLSTEIAAAATTRTAAPATTTAAAPKGLSLGDLSKLVKGGEALIAEYQSRALALGYSADDAAALTQLLQDELNTLAIASRRHVQIDGELAARSLSGAEVEAAVKAGSQTIDDYTTWLINNGYGATDAALLRALLQAKLDAAAAKAAG